MRHKSIFNFSERASSFVFALRGIKLFFQSETHAKIHGISALVVIALGFRFELRLLEWISVLFCIALVWAAEMFNTAIEKTLDLLHPEHSPKVAFIKDVSAGAVLVVSLASLLIAFVIFGERVFYLINRP